MEFQRVCDTSLIAKNQMLLTGFSSLPADLSQRPADSSYPVKRVRPRLLADRHPLGPGVIRACGAQSCSAGATVTPQS